LFITSGIWNLIIDYDYPYISKLRMKQCLLVKNYQTFHRAVVFKLCITNKLKTQIQSIHIFNKLSNAIQKRSIIIVIVQFWTITKKRERSGLNSTIIWEASQMQRSERASALLLTVISYVFVKLEESFWKLRFYTSVTQYNHVLQVSPIKQSRKHKYVWQLKEQSHL